MTTLKSVSKDIETKAKNANFPLESIAHKLTVNVPVIGNNLTIGEVKYTVAEQIDNYETINYIYVVTKGKRLQGVLSIKDLFRYPPETEIGKVMKTDLIHTHPKIDKERVAHLAVKHSLKAIPVVDDKNKFLGVVSSDTILAILDAEYREDFLKLIGVVGKLHYDEVAKMPVLQSFSKRVPWILVGLLGGTITASTISNFQVVLEKNIVLASFIPLIAYIANAVAAQTQTLFIRDLAIHSSFKFNNYLAKQIATSALIAISCWILVLIITTVFWQSSYLGLVVGLSMFSAILTATVLGLIIPQVLNKFRLDPAIGSGPFATVIQDFLSVTIYFAVSSVLLT